MHAQIRLNRFHCFIFLAMGGVFTLSCQLSSVVQQYATTQPTTALSVAEKMTGSATLSFPITATSTASTPTQVVVQATPLPTIRQVAGLVPADRPTYTPTPFLPSFLPGKLATAPSQKAPIVSPAQTRSTGSAGRSPARAVVPVTSPTPARISATPTPAYQYHVSFSWCGPNWLTFVEGTVTQNGLPKNGLLVRIAVGPDSPPEWSDYKTGTDPAKPGGYTQIIDANAPHGGLWYLWIVDPQTNKRVSDITLVRTDPKHVDEGSCQSATVNFIN